MLTEWKEVQQVVIGYIYEQGVDSFNLAIARLKKTYFEGNCLWLWGILVSYNTTTLGVPSEKEQFRKFARAKGVEEKQLFSLEEELAECKDRAKNVDGAAFIWHMGRLAEIYRHMRFEDVIQSSQQRLTRVGYMKAKGELLAELSAIETGGIDLSQEGNVVDEYKDVMREITEAPTLRKEFAIELGFPSLDRDLLGVYPGELLLYVGWTGSGKTTMCVNTAVHNAFSRKRNVVYITTETIRSPLRRRLYARMMMLSQFAEYVPVSSQKMKSGELTEDERKTLLYLENFLASGSHGVLQVVQAPAYATIEWVRGKLLQFESQFKVDLVIIDDLRSLTPTVSRRQEFAEITQIVRDLKGLARTHANRGVPVISPHHISREAYRKVTESDKAMFDLAGLSGSSEAEKRSDIILGSWYDREENEHQVRVDVLKMRDGKAGRSVPLRVQWDFQYLYEAERAGADF
jgi:replicative DNA helicase